MPELFTPPRPAVPIEFPVCRGTLPEPGDEFIAAPGPGSPRAVCVRGSGAGGGGGWPLVLGSPWSFVAAGRWDWVALRSFRPWCRWVLALSLLEGLLAGLPVFISVSALQPS